MLAGNPVVAGRASLSLFSAGIHPMAHPRRPLPAFRKWSAVTHPPMPRRFATVGALPKKECHAPNGMGREYGRCTRPSENG
jgi:hypothetical protein